MFQSKKTFITSYMLNKGFMFCHPMYIIITFCFVNVYVKFTSKYLFILIVFMDGLVSHL
jgi:hypothetical protein